MTTEKVLDLMNDVDNLLGSCYVEDNPKVIRNGNKVLFTAYKTILDNREFSDTKISEILHYPTWIITKIRIAIDNMEKEGSIGDIRPLLSGYKYIMRKNVQLPYMINKYGFVFNVNLKQIVFGKTNPQGYNLYFLKYEHEGETLEYATGAHRLVAIAFISNPNNLPIVNHKNGKKLDCYISNLEWTTSSGNVSHAIRTGLKPIIRGINIGTNVYNEDQIHEACRLICLKIYSPIQIERMCGVGKDTINNIRLKISWLHISNIYDIPNPPCKYDGHGRLISQKVNVA